MMYKGLVLEKHKRYLLIHTDDGDYLKIKVKPHVDAGNYIAFFDEDVIRNQGKSKGYLGTMVATILICIVVLSTFFNQTSQVYAIIGVDVADGIELKVDQNAKVLSVQTPNASDIDDLNHLVGLSAKEAITELTNQNIVASKTGSNVLISETLVNHESNSIIHVNDMTELMDDKGDNKINYYYISSSTPELEMARQNNMTAGSYKVYKTLYPDVPAGEYKSRYDLDKTLSQLRDEIRAKYQDDTSRYYDLNKIDDYKELYEKSMEETKKKMEHQRKEQKELDDHYKKSLHDSKENYQSSLGSDFHQPVDNKKLDGYDKKLEEDIQNSVNNYMDAMEEKMKNPSTGTQDIQNMNQTMRDEIQQSVDEYLDALDKELEDARKKYQEDMNQFNQSLYDSMKVPNYNTIIEP